MNAQVFRNIWLDYSKNYLNNSSVKEHWNNNGEWTNYLLHQNRDNFIKIFKEFGFASIIFEYRKIDITVFSKEKYKEICYYDNSDHFDTSIPINIEAIIEHENDYRRCFEEIKKIIELKAKLKVLITYPPDIDSKNAIIENLEKSLKQSNGFFPENSTTEYLLIFGEYNTTLKWEFIFFDYYGNLKDRK